MIVTTLNIFTWWQQQQQQSYVTAHISVRRLAKNSITQSLSSSLCGFNLQLFSIFSTNSCILLVSMQIFRFFSATYFSVRLSLTWLLWSLYEIVSSLYSKRGYAISLQLVYCSTSHQWRTQELMNGLFLLSFLPLLFPSLYFLIMPFSFSSFCLPLDVGTLNRFNASCSKLLLFEGFSAILV